MAAIAIFSVFSVSVEALRFAGFMRWTSMVAPAARRLQIPFLPLPGSNPRTRAVVPGPLRRNRNTPSRLPRSQQRTFEMPAEPQAKKDRFADAAEHTAAAERQIQQEIGRKEKARPERKKADQPAMQAGARRYPEPPFPKEDLGKPGRESPGDP